MTFNKVTKFTNKSFLHQDNDDEVEYSQPENILEIEVRDPLTRCTGSLKYTDYEIVLKTNLPMFKPESSVRRRYSDFESFHSVIMMEFPSLLQVSLPSKVVSNRFSDSTIEERRLGFENYLKTVAGHPFIQNTSKVLCSFLQEQQFLI